MDNRKAFDEEKEILDFKLTLLDDIKTGIKSEKFESPFLPGDQEYHSDLELWKKSELLKEEERKHLEQVMKNPYFRKAVIEQDGEQFTFYFGDNFYTNNQLDMYDWRTSFFEEVFTSTVECQYNGKLANIMFKRKLNIANGILIDVQEEYDRDGNLINLLESADEFLKKILESRRNDQQLRSIISSIDKKQLEIVHTKHVPLLVQGIAGSGKTMIMLHKLSYFKYNNPNYDFSKVKVIFPNNINSSDEYKKLIKELHIEDLQFVSKIEYFEMLVKRFITDKIDFHKVKKRIDGKFILKLYSPQFELEVFEKIENYFTKFSNLAIIEKYNDIVPVFEREFNDDIIENFKTYEECNIPYLSYINDFSKNILNSALNMITNGSGHQSFYKKYKNKDKMIIELENEISLLKIEKDELFAKVKQDCNRFNINVSSSDHYGEIQNSVFNFIKNFIADNHLCDYSVENLKMLNELDFSEILQKTEIIDEIELFYSEIINWFKNKYPILCKDRNALVKLIDKMTKFDTGGAKIYELKLNNLDKEINEKMNIYNEYLEKKNSINNVNQIENAKLAIEYIDLCNLIYNTLASIVKIDDRLAELLYEKELLESKKIDLFYILFDFKKFLDDITFLKLYTETVKSLIDQYAENYTFNYEKSYIYTFELPIILNLCSLVYNKPKVYDEYVCIDEAQELSEIDFSIIKKVNSENLIVNLFGDINQATTLNSIRDWDFPKYLFEINSIYVLNENYRNTVKIVNEYNAKLNKNDIPIGLIGEEVITHNISKQRLNISFLDIQKYKDYVVILKDINSEIAELFKKHNFDIKKISEVKGLEFNNVIVVETFDMKENEKYVAYTRALSKLIVYKIIN